MCLELSVNLNEHIMPSLRYILAPEAFNLKLMLTAFIHFLSQSTLQDAPPQHPNWFLHQQRSKIPYTCSLLLTLCNVQCQLALIGVNPDKAFLLTNELPTDYAQDFYF